MAYDEDLEERFDRIVSRWPNTVSKKMFGGICHLLNGSMLGGVYHTYLILRLGEEGAWEALKQPFSRPFDITGKPMKSWVMIEGKGIARQGTRSLAQKAAQICRNLAAQVIELVQMPLTATRKGCRLNKDLI